MAHPNPKLTHKPGRRRARPAHGPSGSRDVPFSRPIGAKEAALDALVRAGLPAPSAFVIAGPAADAMDAVRDGVAQIEARTGRRFGDPANPLLLAVRSAGPHPMPGLMPAVLNLGINDQTLAGLSPHTGRRFALDCYRRFLAGFGACVLDVDSDEFDGALSALHRDTQTVFDIDLRPDDLALLVSRYKAIIRKHAGHELPADPWEQLRMAIAAALRSWNSARAVAYRRQHAVAGPPAVAVIVQAMVFGNAGDDSAAGTASTRDPATGESRLSGQFLVQGQGPDLGVGERTPLPLERLSEFLPRAWAQLRRVAGRIERVFRDARELDFVIEGGRLWVLSARPAPRSPAAAVRVAVDLCRRGLIDQRTAILRVEPSSLVQLLHAVFDPTTPTLLLARGLPASPGAAAGKIAFSAVEAEQRAHDGEPVILVVRETEPADVAGMHLCAGILTSSGGMTSHAAVVARGMGIPCVSGAGEVAIRERERTLRIGGRSFGPDDWLSIDGAAGHVYRGQVPAIAGELTGPLKTLLKWADRARRTAFQAVARGGTQAVAGSSTGRRPASRTNDRLEACPTLDVLANADTPADARLARDLGAKGIGLCRTEHMFFSPDRIGPMRKLILAADDAAREQALAQLLPMQRQDFAAIFQAMRGLPVMIRLLDPPLHEFLPRRPADVEELARELGLSPVQVAHRVEQLREANPMLGHRGCRLLLTVPQILRMQVRAVVEAAAECRRAGVRIEPQIMVPLICCAREMVLLRQMISESAEDAMRQAGVKMRYEVATMIELPAAALAAGEIAKHADFISFGTNDLTQTTLGLSRDDTGRFLPHYVESGLLDHDPFQSLDLQGVGMLIEQAVKDARAARPGISCGVCGEHGGDPASIAFFARIGIDYVSCSPYRVPIARLAAAQAAIMATAKAQRR